MTAALMSQVPLGRAGEVHGETEKSGSTRDQGTG